MSTYDDFIRKRQSWAQSAKEENEKYSKTFDKQKRQEIQAAIIKYIQDGLDLKREAIRLFTKTKKDEFRLELFGIQNVIDEISSGVGLMHSEIAHIKKQYWDSVTKNPYMVNIV